MNVISIVDRLRGPVAEALKPVKRGWNLLTMPARRAKLAKTPHEIVFRENKWKLLRYTARTEGFGVPRRPSRSARSGKGCAYATPVLLVPSLINRHYVLDLQPGKSLVEYLVAQGHDVFVLDWGKPGREDRLLTFDDVCDRYLGRAIREAARRSPDERVHVLGYCLGGTLAAIHTAANPKHVASLVALAAPVTFHDDGLLSTWCRTKSFDINLLIDALGNVPAPLMQAAFQLLRPTLGLSKMVHTVDRSWNREFLDGFQALEHWGNDNIPFPGEVFRTYISELYQRDAFARGTFRLAGKPAKMESIRCPVLAITFEHDNIVPWKSAALLVDRAGSRDKQRIHLNGGHVGAVVARAAAKGLWPQLSQFWAARDAASAARAKRAA